MEQVIHEVKTVEEGHEAHKHALGSLNKRLELNAVFFPSHLFRSMGMVQ